MRPARIAELLQPFLAPCYSEPSRRLGEEAVVLSSSQLLHISTYIDLLIHWNSRVNLTAIRDEEEIVTRHFGESLFAAQHLFPTKTHGAADAFVRQPAHIGAPHVADLGSGAGFPGIPIKLWAPQISLTLIESSHKKSTFLREVTRSLTLTDINIQNARAETITETFDVVALRAVEHFATILPVAARLLAPNGRLALLVASSQVHQARASLDSVTWQSPQPIPQSHSRLLLIGQAGI